VVSKGRGVQNDGQTKKRTEGERIRENQGPGMLLEVFLYPT